MSAEDYYKVLGVSKNATDEEIKTAYRKLAFEFHPDRNSSAYAEERIKEINLAYSVLSDPEKKAEYDREGVFRTGRAGPFGAGGPGYSRSSEGSGDGFYWKKEYTWTWGGSAGNSGSRNGGRTGTRNSGASQRSYTARPGTARPDGKKGKRSHTWDAVDMILRLFGILAVFWLIVRRPMLAVLLVISAAFLLAVWTFMKDLIMVSGRKK